MSNKSNSDNRSNQLNPNNDAYHSSRGGSQYGDDDDDGSQHSGRAVSVAPAFQRVEVTRSATYGFGAVSMVGEAVFVTATFHATANSLCPDPVRDCEYRLDSYLDAFIPYARSHLLRALGQNAFALFAVFDPSPGRMPFHAPLFLDDVEKTKEAVCLAKCAIVASTLRPVWQQTEANKKFREALSSVAGNRRAAKAPEEEKQDPEPFLKALREAIGATSASLGEFQVSYNGIISSDDGRVVLARLAELRLTPTLETAPEL